MLDEEIPADLPAELSQRVLEIAEQRPRERRRRVTVATAVGMILDAFRICRRTSTLSAGC
jgi:hypothetical protein